MDGSIAQTSISLNAASVRNALRLIKPACPSRYTVPPRLGITSHHGQAALTGRDLEMEITVALEEPYRPFSGALPHRELAALLRPRKVEETVSLVHTGETSVKIMLPDASASIIASQTDFGARLKEKEQSGISARIDAKPLAKALELVSGVMSTEETRYYLNGVFIQPHATDFTALNFVATDGHRLVAHTVTGLRHNFTTGIIVPRDAVNALRALLAAYPNATLQMNMHGDMTVNITHSSFELATKLIDGAFPDYTRVIPQGSPQAAIMDATAMRRFLLRVGAVGWRGPNGIKITTKKGSDKVLLSWASSDIGTLTTAIDGRCDRNLEIGFQSHYLSHMLGILKTPQITMYTPEGTHPTIFTGAAELADPLTTIVLMPLRL